MPEYGLCPLTDMTDRLEAPAESAEPWDLVEVRVISVTFELRKEQALPLLPESLIRPVPAYAKVLVVDAASSPAGAYREASLLLGARDGVQIRNVLIDSIVAGARQLAAARERFGGRRRAGKIGIEHSDQAIQVSVADEDGPLCELELEDLRRCDATMLKFDALLVAGEVQGQPALLRYGVRVPLDEVEGTLSRRWHVTMQRPATAWHSLSPAHPVTAFAAFGAARIEPARPPREAPTRA